MPVASAQEEIVRLEAEMAKTKKKLAELRREAAKVPVEDCELKTPQGTVKLSQLFGQQNELILIHNMGKQCRWCTMWADGFNGVRHHLENKAAFAVMSADDPQTQLEFASGRAWKFRMVSSAGSGIAEKLGFEVNGERKPGVSVLTKEQDGKLYQVSKAGFGPGDNFCVVYDLFDLLPAGVGDWEPQYQYETGKGHSSCCQH